MAPSPRFTLADLRRAARELMADGHDACLIVELCQSGSNLMTPAEFVDWLELWADPPSTDVGLTAEGRERIAEGQRRRRERERAAKE